MEAYMVWIWLAVFLLAILIEAISQDLVAVWFALGALIALILSGFQDITWYVELIVFAFVSLFVMVLIRPFTKKILHNSIRYTNIDEMVGKRVGVLKEINKYEPGEVKINGIVYSASLLEEVYDPIKVGDIVEIVTFKGNKVVVKKIV